MRIKILAIAALMLSTSVHADDAPATTTGSHIAGANALIEADFQVGTFIGSRVKTTVYSGNSFTMDVEGLYGNNLAAFEPSSGSSSTAWGGGLRLNHPLSNGSRNVWQLSPGLDFYDANSQHATFIAPNVDIAWTHEFAPHFSSVLGFQGGVQVGFDGHSDSGDSYSGKSIADIGVYLGARF